MEHRRTMSEKVQCRAFIDGQLQQELWDFSDASGFSYNQIVERALSEWMAKRRNWNRLDDYDYEGIETTERGD